MNGDSMAQYHWATCPPATRSQVEQILVVIQNALGNNLTGVYLHGSLAMGCFNPARSDLDLLAVTRQPMRVETKRTLAEALLRLSGQPAPIEISFLSAVDLTPWRSPTPFDLHYSESWRARYERALADDTWRQWNEQRQTDIDLAAHITLTRARGICLLGQPIADALPPVPAQDYIASIWDDFLAARAEALKNPPYFIMNACRVAAYLTERRICSKEEGAVWALNTLPDAFRGLIEQALEVYHSDKRGPFDAGPLERFGAYMEERLRPLASPGAS